MKNDYQSNDKEANLDSPFVTSSGLCYLGEFVSCCGYVISKEKYISHDDFWEDYQDFCQEKNCDTCGEIDFMRTCDKFPINYYLDPIEGILRVYITKKGTEFSPKELNDCLENQSGTEGETNLYFSERETKKNNMKTEISESLLLKLVCQFTKMWIHERYLLHEMPIPLSYIRDKYKEYCSEHDCYICSDSEFNIVLNSCGLEGDCIMEDNEFLISELY